MEIVKTVNMHSLSESSWQRVILLLEYYGSLFSGSQRQNYHDTVQNSLEKALDALHIIHKPVHFAGRTDAGVHAKGQVAHFDIPANALDKVPDLIAALNATLPETISVKNYAITHDFDFHAQYSARWRWYQYRIYNMPARSVWMRKDAAWLKMQLNLEAMQQGAKLFLGENNFKSFKGSNTDVTNNICRIIHSQVSIEGDYIVFDVISNRFLYKMVRNLAGTLIEIGVGSGFKVDDIPVILEQGDRRFAGPTAKPNGLSLMAVNYPEKWDFFQNDVYVTTLKQQIQESSSNEKNLFCKAS